MAGDDAKGTTVQEPPGTGSIDQPPLQPAEYECIQKVLKMVEETKLTPRERHFADYRCVRRYSRANRFDAEKAYKRLMETLKWRKDFGVDALVSKDLDILKKQADSGKMYTYGFDRERHPIVCMHPARENIHDHDGSLKSLVYTMERAVSDMENGVEKLVLCIDFVGYSVFNAPPWKTSKATLDILQYHYPERLHKSFKYTPPWAFSAFWKMISPFIDPITKAKVHMVNQSTVEEKRTFLVQYIDASHLGKEFGGDAESHFARKRPDMYWAREEPISPESRVAFLLGARDSKSSLGQMAAHPLYDAKLLGKILEFADTRPYWQKMLSLSDEHPAGEVASPTATPQ